MSLEGVSKRSGTMMRSSPLLVAMIAGAIVKVIENSGHMAPLPAYDSYALVLEDFFRAVDGGSP